MNVRLLNLMVLLGCIVLLSSCASGPKFVPVSDLKNDEALIYVYRTSRILGAANTWIVRANGEPIGEIASGTYCAFRTKPGSIAFSSKLKTDFWNKPLWGDGEDKEYLLTVTPKAGETIYLEWQWLSPVRPDLAMVSEDVGRKEIKSCKLANIPEN